MRGRCCLRDAGPRQPPRVPLGPSRLLAFIHPIVALLVIGFLAYVGSLGLRSRSRTEAHLRPRHARLAPWAYALMIANAAGGVLSTWSLRPDLGVGRSVHVRFALLIVTLLTITALISRRIAASDAARVLHPLLGLIVLLLAGLQVFFGMALLPG